MAQREVIVINGMTGSGKSTWLARYLENTRRYVFYDTLCESLEAGSPYSKIQAPGFDHPTLLLERLKARCNSEFLDAVFRPKTDSLFPIFCRLAGAVGNLTVAIEELDVHCNAHFIPPEFERLIKYGRHQKISLVAVARRPAEISRLYTSQANRYVIFRQIEENDISHWRKMFGDVALRLKELEPGYHLDVNFNDPASIEKLLSDDPFHEPVTEKP